MAAVLGDGALAQVRLWQGISLVQCEMRTLAMTAAGHVWTAHLRQVLIGVASIAVGCSHVSGLFLQSFPATAGPDVGSRGGS